MKQSCPNVFIMTSGLFAFLLAIMPACRTPTRKSWPGFALGDAFVFSDAQSRAATRATAAQTGPTSANFNQGAGWMQEQSTQPNHAAEPSRPGRLMTTADVERIATAPVPHAWVPPPIWHGIAELADSADNGIPADLAMSPDLEASRVVGPERRAISAALTGNSVAAAIAFPPEHAQAPIAAAVQSELSLRAQDAVRPSVRLIVAGVRPGRGKLKVAVFTDPTSFLQPTGASHTFELNSDQTTIELELILDGRFAVAVFQDIDGDGHLTRNRLGVPVEPFAFSNNAMGQRGPPDFLAASVVASTTLAAEPLIVPIDLP